MFTHLGSVVQQGGWQYVEAALFAAQYATGNGGGVFLA